MITPITATLSNIFISNNQISILLKNNEVEKTVICILPSQEKFEALKRRCFEQGTFFIEGNLCKCMIFGNMDQTIH